MSCCICTNLAEKFVIPLEIVLNTYKTDSLLLDQYEYNVQCRQCVEGLYCAKCFLTYIKNNNKCAVCRTQFSSAKYEYGFQHEDDFLTEYDPEDMVFLFDLAKSPWEYELQVNVIGQQDIQFFFGISVYASDTIVNQLRNGFIYDLDQDIQNQRFPQDFIISIKKHVLIKTLETINQGTLTQESPLLGSLESFQVALHLYSITVDQQSINIHLLQTRSSFNTIASKFVFTHCNDHFEKYFLNEGKVLNIEGLTPLTVNLQQDPIQII